MSVNKALLTEVLSAIQGAEILKAELEDEGNVWRQSDWAQARYNDQDEVCGTAMCFAGWAVELSKQCEMVYVVPTADDKLRKTTSLRELNEWLKQDPEMAGRVDYLVRMSQVTFCPDKPFKTIELGIAQAAETLLGLNEDQGETLFHGYNSLERLEELVKALLNDEEAVRYDDIEGDVMLFDEAGEWPVL